ncbi:MAG: hypothetical protein ACYDCK_10515 [Thermoplasmatota archaeon]
MDLLSCESRSRCPLCHHWTTTGCELKTALLYYEGSQQSKPTRQRVHVAARPLAIAQLPVALA